MLINDEALEDYDIKTVCKKVKKIIRKMADPHFSINYLSLVDTYYPINSLWINDDLVFVPNMKDDSPEYRDLFFGKIVYMNGKPFCEVFEEYSNKFIGFPLSQLKNMFIEDIVLGEFEENIQIKIKQGNDFFNIKINPTKVVRVDTGTFKKMFQKISFSPIIQKINSDTLYVKIPTFCYKDFDYNEFLQISGKNVIIDLRSNQGGYVNNAVEILSYILGRDLVLDKFKVVSKLGYEKIVIHSKNISSCKKIVVLINEFTMSSSEYIFAQTLKNYTNAILVGRQSGGVSGQAKMFEFSNGVKLSIITKRYIDNNELEIQTGIKPDYEIKNDISYLDEGVDNQLTFAMGLINREVN